MSAPARQESPGQPFSQKKSMVVDVTTSSTSTQLYGHSCQTGTLVQRWGLCLGICVCVCVCVCVCLCVCVCFIHCVTHFAIDE